MLINSISFENGANSEFSMVFDGLDTNRVEDYTLASGDSAVIFIDFVSDRKDDFARDRVVFEIGDLTQRVDVEAYIMDAIFYKDSTLVNQTTVFNPNMAHVIDGPLIVPDGYVLQIPAGTQVYFTPRKDENFNLISCIFALGTVRVNGQLGNEVIFQQTRFGERYEENPGQWRGLIFGQTSASNILEHCIVKNGLIGVECDYAQLSGLEKVKINSCEIRNMAAFGILGYGYSTPGQRVMIDARNTLVQNCQEGTVVILGGGQYRFLNCTFANYTMDFSRNAPQVIINNYDPDALVAFECKADFRNCLIWGTEEEEVALDSAVVADAFDVTFNNCMIRSEEPEFKGANNIFNTDLYFPNFMAATESEPLDRDYHLSSGSPAIDAGADLSIYGFSTDKDQVVRGATWDIGCYEYAN